MRHVIEKVIDYVMARRCRGGGFCFYRLDEPNGLDTFSALTVLQILGVSFRDNISVAYLQNMQHSDGSYDSVFSAFYSLKSLLVLNADPKQDPWPYILKHIRQDQLHADKLPAEITPVFKRITFLVDLYCAFNKNPARSAERQFTDFILNFYNEDKGFGHLQSTLAETSRALSMLSWLGYPVQILHTATFIRQCETPAYGFTDIPDRSLSYLEYVYAGVLAASLADYRLRYPEQCIDFIRGCQNKTGGFSRVIHGGIATMEDTYFAVNALKLLSALQ